MLRKEVQIERPERWDVPFDSGTSGGATDRILQTPPFSQMSPAAFPEGCSLRGLVENDTRLVHFAPADIVVRQGDYGNSAFLVLDGTARVTIDPLPNELLGRPTRARPSLLKTLWQSLIRPRIPECRGPDRGNRSAQLGQRQDGDATRVFLQDVPGILDEYRSLQIGPGEFFGEVAALSRTPRSATVFAESPLSVLEIRWQGLRDLMKFDNALRDHIHQLYRRNSLATHLRQTPLLKTLTEDQIDELVQRTRFETFGHFDWYRPFNHMQDASSSERIDAEPVIAREGSAANGLVLIRNGFARLSQQYGHGHRTVSYLGKGQTYGLVELYQQWKRQTAMPLIHSLRAIGYVDVLRIPQDLIESYVLPNLQEATRQELEQYACPETQAQFSPTVDPAPVARPIASTAEHSVNTGLLEFIVENRFMNGSQTMMIDMHRCTRCDDCVRACADLHDGNPRFVRQGPQFGQQMFASACMHCVDPVCMIGCPTGAIARDEQSGTVVINDPTCIGCSTCANSCPYGAIRMVDIRDPQGGYLIDRSTRLPISKATKCDLCTNVWSGPACERACPHDALVRIDLQQPDTLARRLNQIGATD